MNDEPTDAQLTRLADGSLPDAQADTLRARVRESPELQARLREQEQSIALTQATAQITAPASLRAAVREQTSSTRARTLRRPVWRPRLLAPLATGALAAAIVIIVLLTGSSRSLTVARTARLALATPTRNAPSVDPSDSELLSLRVDSIPFPAYEGRSDWRATGARTDQVDARRVQTVFYDIAGDRVGYSIVPGAALGVPAGHQHTIGGVRYVIGGDGAAELVTWRRDGHTCVIAGRRVSAQTLLRLATATETT